MPVNKNKLLRVRTIDECLQRRHRVWTAEELREACGDRLSDLTGKQDMPGLRTIAQDIADMRNGAFGYHAPIEFDKERGGYCYTDPNFSINANPLRAADIPLLETALETLKSHQAREVYDDFFEMLTRVKGRMRINDDQDSIIQYDHAPRTTGIQWLEELMGHIRNQRVLHLHYHPFEKDPQETDIHPYLLKEYNNRWYVIGYDEAFGHVSFRALDRIKDIKPNRYITYKPNTYFDPGDFFRYLIGVTWKQGEKPERVRFKASPDQAQYLETKPLHMSQELLKRTKTYSLFQIEVVLNYELEQALLRLGEKVRVIGPERLVDSMKNRIDSMKKNYDGS